MSDALIIPAHEQAYLLNKQLIARADNLHDAVITIGGQAVQYWVAYYRELYSGVLPDQRIITSVDLDYSARRHDIIAIAEALGVDPAMNEGGHPPSLARFALLDSKTHAIKEVNGRYFAEPDCEELRPNTIDVIDFPSGFTWEDFSGERLLLNTERFWIEAQGPDEPESHELVRVINPIACLKSRFSNLMDLRRNPEIETGRIKALMLPAVYFLLEKLEQGCEGDGTTFRDMKKHVDALFALVMQERVARKQAEYDLKLYAIFEQLAAIYAAEPEHYDVPPLFWQRELPNKAMKVRQKVMRLAKDIARRKKETQNRQNRQRSHTG
ncbi:hypothetical protein [[Erwinia] mediterraneensis]|uniref:hypothetical protein n=1 Tax=[Erwinia] mediterraneensis TaxID=2161819 RepID=UPI001A923076|nr:hypothetical protein [[Erwinia] mediterraneensis]